MAHDFMKEMVGHHHHSSSGPVYLGLGGALLLTAFLSRFAFGDDVRSALAALAAALFLGAPLVFNAVKDLFADHSDMNELAALGVIATFVSGQFVTSATIAFVMAMVALLEHRSAQGAQDSLADLLDLHSPEAWVPQGDDWVQIPVSNLKAGDRVQVRPGERIPVDGIVLEGESSVNQATITGESLPVDKEPGESLFAGTVNLTGVLICRVVSVGEQTTIGMVRQLIAKAEATKTPIMQTIDRHIRWYILVVLFLAGAVLFGTRDLDRMVAMVVVACPCSILLAGPTAVVAVLGVAARLGILIKDVACLEVADRLTAMVFDKTGTLTEGRLHVTEVEPEFSWSREELMAVAAAVERGSSHPVAKSVCRYVSELGVPVPSASDVQERHGKGVEGTVNGRSVMLGQRDWLQEAGISIPSLDLTLFQGQSLLYVGVDGRYAGLMALEDRPKADVVVALDRIRRQGIDDLSLLSGDRDSVVTRIASAVGIGEYCSEMLPQDKMAFVNAKKEQGAVVAVVGDGVNDGPALSAGDLSFAMGAAGSDLAISSSSIALMNDDVTSVPAVIELGRETLAVIRQNLWISFGSIASAMILGAMGWVHPVMAALLHGGASMAVVLNSARLVRFKEGSSHDR